MDLKLLANVAVPNTVGFLIGMKFGPSKKKNPEISAWYDSLVQPALKPPNWIFAPVWTYLYSSMGVAAWFISQNKDISDDKKFQLSALYGTQLLVNFIWSPLFFGAKRMGLALFDITVLLGLLGYLCKSYFEVDKRAGYAVLPYIAWVSFASYLNFSFWRNNPSTEAK